MDRHRWRHVEVHPRHPPTQVPTVPKERPSTAQARNRIIKEVARFAAKAVARQKSAAERDGYRLSTIEAVENVVLIPRLKHWEITGWYMKENIDYDGLSPREYLRGKTWDERMRTGRDALIMHGVLKP